MKYDFDRVIDRRGTDSLKYDFAVERGKKEDILPLWVADMDFQTAPEIINSLKTAVEHGIYGYTESKDDYFEAIASWYRKRYNWELRKEWLVKTPGVVFALAMAIRGLTSKGDAVMIQQPVYYPFSEVITDNDRRLVVNSLMLSGGKYYIDFEDFEDKIINENVKLFILCNPHNPVGRVWKEDELLRIGRICLKHNVLVVCDEIHSDFIYPDNKHISFASLSPELADITITATSPTKTFNLAGLQISNIFISNRQIRLSFLKEIASAGYSQVGTMGLKACKTAYEKGEEWLEELMVYLKGNLDYLRDYLSANLPGVRLIEPEGTYLVWLDFRMFNLSKFKRDELIEQKAGLWLDNGSIFGADGEGFERINIACPRSTLKIALEKLCAAFKESSSDSYY